MANFAQLNEENIVENVIVIPNEDILDENGLESEEIGIAICKELVPGSKKWKQTSYNNNIRFRYAGIGSVYNEEIDAFITPKPYESWILNNETAEWEAPIPAPEIEEDKQKTHMHVWDENNLTWILEPIPSIYMLSSLNS